MKKLCWIFAICLLLTACSNAPAPETTTALPTTDPVETIETVETTEPTEADYTKNEPTQSGLQIAPVESSAWAAYAHYGDKLGIVLNEPVENPPVATTTWIEGEYECGYIIPRFSGSTVNLYMLQWAPDFSTYTIADEPDFSTVAGDGCIIYTVLPRPEGMPMWYLEINAPNGVGDGYVLEYNGRVGTAPVEFFEYRTP